MEEFIVYSIVLFTYNILFQVPSAYLKYVYAELS